MKFTDTKNSSSRQPSRKSQLTAALSLPGNASAADIDNALKAAPPGSAADFLWKALPEDFTTIKGDDELDEALKRAYQEGSTIVDQAFAEALRDDAIYRKLLTDGGEIPGRVQADEFGEPFDLEELVLSAPFAQAFTEESLATLNSTWGFTPARGDSLLALRLFHADDDADQKAAICEEAGVEVDPVILGRCRPLRGMDYAHELVRRLREAQAAA